MKRKDMLLRFLRRVCMPLRNASGNSLVKSRRPFQLEPLEHRRLLAADGVIWPPLDSEFSWNVAAIDSSSILAGGSVESTVQRLTWSDMPAEGEGNLEGEAEAGDDLVAFAKALALTDTVMYGADWCAICSDQKRLFEDGAKYLPYIDVTNTDGSPNDIADSKNITTYPTWIFPDESRLEGLQSLATISQRSGVIIPQSAVPYVPELDNVNVGIGSPVHVPIDAFSPSGLPLTITVASSNPDLISASVVNSNRSMKIETDFGDMVFEMFEDKAPRPAGRVIELAQDGFYDGIIFHRVIDGFMIQGGDPTGTGTGGSPLGVFDDQFHLDLQHNRSGVLSFAKAGDDTNNSQFFITAGPTRHLDFNHSVFGQLVEGDYVRNAISRTATNASDRPLNPVVMRNVTIFDDDENGLIFLKATGPGTGSADITVTVADGQGNSTIRTFTANVIQDTANGAPFLNEIPVLQAISGVPLKYTLTSQDKEGDPPFYAVAPIGDIEYELSVDSTTGEVTFTAPEDFAGQLEILVGVRQILPATTSDVFDIQRVVVQVSLPPIDLQLDASSDSGSSNSDRVTNASSLTFNVSGTRPGATIQILVGNQVVGSATAASATTQVTVADTLPLGEGRIEFIARQTINGHVVLSPILDVTLDRTLPVPLNEGQFPERWIAATPLDVNLNHPEEGQGLRYSLQNAPTGMTIGRSNGRVQWTPNATQVGDQTFIVVLTDLAGNVSNESVVTIRIVTAPVANEDSAYTVKNETVVIRVLNNDFDGGVTFDNTSLMMVEEPSSGVASVLSNGRIRYIPAADFVGTVTFTYVVSNELGLQSNEATVIVQVRNSRWQNPVSSLDVNNDDRISAIDALTVINYLNSGQPRDLSESGTVPPPYIDVNGDERITAIDALLVINYLNQRSDSGEGESLANNFLPPMLNALPEKRRARWWLEDDEIFDGTDPVDVKDITP